MDSYYKMMSVLVKVSSLNLCMCLLPVLFIVDPDRKCLDAGMCEQFCVRNNITGTENCSCQSGFVLAADLANCTGKMASL